MGSKVQRKNQHIRRLKTKIRRFKAKGRKTDKLLKELGYALGETERPSCKTGSVADARNRKIFGAK